MTGTQFVDRALTVFFIAVGIFAVVDVWDFPLQDRLFPYTAAGLMLFSAVVYGLRQIIARPIKDEAQAETGKSLAESPFSRNQIGTVIPMALAVLGLVAGVFIFGHLIAVPAFVFTYILMRGEKLWIAIAGAGLLFIFIWGLLITVMNVAMPRPFIMDWLNL